MRTSLVVIMFFISFTVSAQRTDSLKRIYVNETVYRYGKSFMKGTERLYFRDLKYEFDFSPVGEGSYLLSRRYRNTSIAMKVLSGLTSIATLFVLADRRNINTMYLGLGAQLAFSLADAYYQNLSTQQLDRALWQRNKDLLFGPK